MNSLLPLNLDLIVVTTNTRDPSDYYNILSACLLEQQYDYSYNYAQFYVAIAISLNCCNFQLLDAVYNLHAHACMHQYYTSH